MKITEGMPRIAPFITFTPATPIKAGSYRADLKSVIYEMTLDAETFNRIIDYEWTCQKGDFRTLYDILLEETDAIDVSYMLSKIGGVNGQGPFDPDATTPIIITVPADIDGVGLSIIMKKIADFIEETRVEA